MHNPFKDELEIEVIFRWNTPKILNGLLLGFKIRCWFEEDNLHYDVFIDYKIQPDINEKHIYGVKKNVTFHCQVKVEMQDGIGNYSPLISVNTQTEKSLLVIIQFTLLILI